jgi:hypothetical protein
MNLDHLTAAVETRATRVWSRPFYTRMALLFLVTVLVGFSNSYRVRAVAAAPPLDPAVRVHAGLFVSWFVIFLAQAVLVRSRRMVLHQTIGSAAAVVAALIVLNGPALAVSAARRGTLPGDGLALMLMMIGDVLGFGAFVAAALYCRRNGDVHKRLMLLGTTSLLPPAIVRWPLVTGNQAAVGIVMVAFLAAAPFRDRLNGRRAHPVSFWGGLALLASVPLRMAVAQSAAWHRFATWLIN